jgi:hypothetical protein
LVAKQGSIEAVMLQAQQGQAPAIENWSRASRLSAMACAAGASRVNSVHFS